MARSRRVQTDLELYLKQIDESPLLSADEEKHLARKIINEGCMASREHMIRSNLRLVVAIAKRYMNRGLSLQDLIEEGNVGLVKAVEGFDPDMGARFSTYGCWWIKQGIKRALINAVQPIHIPAYMVELIAKWKRASRLLEEKLGRTPTVQELAEEMDLPAKKVRIIKKAVKASRRPSQTGSGAEGEGPMLSEMVADARTPSRKTRCCWPTTWKPSASCWKPSTTAKPRSCGCVTASTATSRSRLKRSGCTWGSPASVCARSRSRRSRNSTPGWKVTGP